jgi:quinoprotein glucose dehydrogenase
MSNFRFSFIIAASVLLLISLPSSNLEAKEPARSAHLSFLAIQATEAPPQPQKPADQLPPGEGRDVTLRVCTQCHSVANFAQKRLTKDQWDAILDDMVSKGMSASDDDLGTVEKYLTTYLAPPSDSKTPAPTPEPEPKSN